MKNIKIGLCIIMNMFFLLTTISCNTLLAIRTEINIGNHILKNTPIGSSKEDVIQFIERRGFTVSNNRVPNRPYYPQGITLPENLSEKDFPRDATRYRSPGIGSSHIYSIIKPLIRSTVICVWIFDEDNRLILIDVWKELNW